MTPEERAEIAGAVATLQAQLDALVVRGVRAAGRDELAQLGALHEELGRVGAAYLGGQVGELIARLRGGDAAAAGALCRAQTALRVFDRVLTIATAREALATDDDDADADDDGAAPPAPDAPAPAPAPAPPAVLAERAELLPMLAELAGAVESLIATGLSTASAATRQRLDVAFREASRRKLLRLGAALRYVNEELGRFLADAAVFSPKRFAFFLHRSWLLARGLHEAIREGDAPWIARLLMAREPEPIKRLEVVVLGVGKRVGADGGCAFEFRLRSVGTTGPVAPGTPIVWSCVFAGRKGIPAEAFLHLPQPQQFTPKLLLDGTVVAITDAALSRGEPGGGARLLLGPKSTVTAGARYTEWSAHLATDWAAIPARAAAHRVSPLELDVELQEAVVLHDWQVGAPGPREDERTPYPITADGRELVVWAGAGPGDAELTASLEALRGAPKRSAASTKTAKAAKTAKPAKPAKPSKAAPRGPLFGLLHYERCRLVLQPLAILGDDRPAYLTISTDPISVAGLLGSLDFKA